MRLLYSISYYRPHISGLTRGVEPLIDHFAENGHSVEVLAAQHHSTLPLKEKVGNVSVTRVPVALRLGKGLFMPRHVFESFRAAGRADIVHIIAPQFDAGLTALVARLRGRPVVLSYVCSFHSPGLIGAITTFAVQLSHLLSGVCASRIIALSEDYAQQSRFCKIFWKKLVFVPVPIPNYPAKALPYRKPEQPYRIGFVGRISVEKNIDLLLEALPILRQKLNAPFTLELVGPDEPPGAPGNNALNKRIAATPAQELQRLGTLSEDDLDAFYRGIDILLLPSIDRIEAYGMVQVEAMLRGVPCVTSDLPGMREPIKLTGFGALFSAGSANALAHVVAEILEGRPLTPPKPETLHACFDPSKVFSQVQGIYDSLSKNSAISIDPGKKIEH